MLSSALILIGPILVGVLLLLLRRWPAVTVAVGVISVWVLAAVILVTGQGQSSQGEIGPESVRSLFGFPIFFRDYIRVALAFVYITFGFIFILSRVAPQGNNFIAGCLLILSPLAASMSMQPFIIGAIFFVIIGALSAVLIQDKRPGSTLGSMRHLTLAILAVPSLLISGWVLSTGQAQYLSVATYLLLLAILLLLLAFPFQYWLGPNISESRSLVPVVVFGAVQMIVALFCLQMLVNNPIVYANARFLSILRASGAVTLLFGSMLILTSRSLGRLFGYLLLLDVGATMLALSLGGRPGLQITIGLFLLRTIGLVFAGVGLGLIQAQKNVNDGNSITFDNLAGLSRTTPWGVALFLFGLLSLAGVPVTPGFSGRWVLISVPSSLSNLLSAVVVVTVALAAIGITRILPAVLAPEDSDESAQQEPPFTRLIAAIMLIFAIVITLWPSLILGLAERLTNQLL